jgi:uncharacterized Ntn-hydrolase superfamily protein
MTYSIVARDPATGMLGVAVASRFFAVGALVPHLRGGQAAVATQAFVNPLWGLEGADRIAAGAHPQAVLDDLAARDAGQRQRQAHAIDGLGRLGAHTGADCIDWAGHLTGEDVSLAGNILAGPEVLADALTAYEDAETLPFAERLLRAMRAGEDAGGDRRGRQSAALVIHRGEDYPWLSIRADDHADPLSELERLLAVAGERFLHVAGILPTRGNFSGEPDRAATDAAIAEAERRRAAEGRPSASHATGPGGR